MPMDKEIVKKYLLAAIDKQLKGPDHDIGVACVEMLLGVLDDIRGIRLALDSLADTQKKTSTIVYSEGKR